MVKQLFIVHNLQPNEFGILNLYLTILNYLNYIDFGLNAGTHASSLELEKNNKADLGRELRKSTLHFIFFYAILTIPIALLVGFIFDQEILAVIFIFGAIAYLYLNFYLVEARARENFTLIAIAASISALFNLLALIAIFNFVNDYKIIYILSLAALTILVNVLVISKSIRLKITGSFSFEEIIKVIKFGIPLTISPLLLIVFLSLDRWILVERVGRSEFGYYALGVTLGSMLAIVPNTISMLISTKIMSSTLEKIRENNAHKPLYYVASIYPLMFGLYLLVLPLFIDTFFNNYFPGILTILVISISYFTLFPVTIVNPLLISNYKNPFNIKILLLFIGLEYLLLENLSFDNEISSFAFYILALYFSYSIVILYVYNNLIYKSYRSFIKTFIRIYYVFTLEMILVGSLYSLFGLIAGNSTLDVIWAVLFYVAINFLFAYKKLILNKRRL